MKRIASPPLKNLHDMNTLNKRTKIAKEKNCLLADLNTDMQAALEEIPDVPGKPRNFGKYFYGGDLKNKLTTDGCHMNKLGNIMMAKGVLRAFGMSESKITRAEKRWLQ